MSGAEQVVCPECKSADVAYSKKRQVYLCAECERSFEGPRGASARRVFLSYGHDGFAPLAERLRDDLRARGHDVWFDAERLGAGADWERAIDDGLARVDEDRGNGRVVLLMTPHAMRRPDGYCLNELARALSRGLTVVPVMVSLCEPPLSICRLQWLDLRDCADPEARADRYEARLAQLVDAVQNDRLDTEGVQSRLLRALQPLPFDVDLAVHLGRFTGRAWFIEEVDRWLADPAGTRVFLVTGRPGLGKTAIAAWLCAKRPEVGAFHLCRHGDVQKADPRWCVRSIAFQLASQLPEYQARLNALGLERLIEECNARTLFDRLVVQPLHGGFPRPERPVVVLIDGLDEATLDGQNELAAFLATEFVKTPAWLRLMLLTRPDPEVMHPLQGITARALDASLRDNEADLAAYVARELAAFAPGGALAPAAVADIVARSEGLFLYVDCVRDELAQGRLALDQLDAFPRGLGGLYARFCKRQFHDLGAYEGLVRQGIELVAAAREPLPLDVVSRALGWDEYRARRFRSALGSLFVTADGTVRPFHQTLLEWLTDDRRAGDYFVSAKGGHERLADASLAQLRDGLAGAPPYALRHAADHLVALRRAGDLAGLLAREDFTAAHAALDPYRLRAWWAWLEREAPERAAPLRRALLDAPPADAARCDAAADLLNSLGHWSDALALYDHAIAIAEAAGDRARVANTLNDKADVLRRRGDADGALACLDRADALVRALAEPAELLRSLTLRADLASHAASHDRASALLEEVERTARAAGDAEHLNLISALQGRAKIVSATRGDHAAALDLLREAEALCRRGGAHEPLAKTLSLIGRIERDRGEPDEARRRLDEMEALCREYGMGRALTVCLNDQGELARKQRRWGDAVKAYEEFELHATRLGAAVDVAVVQGNRASVLAEQGHPEAALALLEGSLAVVRAAGRPEVLVQGLLQMAELLEEKLGRRGEALACAEDALEVATRLGFTALGGRCRGQCERLRPAPTEA